MILRVILAVSGVLLLAYGVGRLLVEQPLGVLVSLGIWLVAALVVHDAVLAPAVVGVGWGLRQIVPDRERRYLQAFLITAGLVTVVALPLIALRGTQPAEKALLLRDYGANLALLVALIAVVCAVAYVVRVVRDRS